MSLAERGAYAYGLLAVSVLLLAVPLYDMWADVAAGKSVLSTLLENSVIVGLTLVFIGLSLWLVRNDWPADSARLVARWSVLGTVAVATTYLWVLGFQRVVQNELKPVIVAADGVVIAGILLFVAGAYNARSKRESDARAAERDRFSALFNNTGNAILALNRRGQTTTVTGVNEPFERTFSCAVADIAGRSVVSTLTEWSVDDQTTADDPADRRIRRALRPGGDQTELRLSTTDGDRDFILDSVPVSTSPGATDTERFLVLTDITAQRSRERQFETLSDGIEGLFGARSEGGVLAALQTLTLALFGASVVGIWEYNEAAEQFESRQTLTTAGDHVDELAAIPAGDGESNVDESALAAALSAQGQAVDSIATRAIGESYQLTVGREDGAFSATDRHLLDLLATNTRTALERVDREQALGRRNDQLEFINSLLRHEIQNSMTIIRARGQALAESQDGRDAEYAETIVTQSDEVRDVVTEFRTLLNALGENGAPDAKPVDLSAMLADRVETLRATHPTATVTTEIPDGVEVHASEMLSHVFDNLLGNAIEHNDAETPTVDVTVSETNRQVTVRVADNGPGIDEEKHAAIFRRGNRGLTESDIGSGFGLFFVDTVVERYGGTATVEDNDPRGTVFVLELPAA